MIKKLLKLIRFFVVGIVWSYIFIALAGLSFIYFWNFNIFSASSWQKIDYFWQAGGIIKTYKDYWFLFSLFFLPILWIITWRKVNAFNFLNVIIYPYELFSDLMMSRRNKITYSSTLKHSKSSEEIVEDIKYKLESIKPEETKEVANIRENVKNKISEAKN